MQCITTETRSLLTVRIRSTLGCSNVSFEIAVTFLSEVAVEELLYCIV